MGYFRSIPQNLSLASSYTCSVDGEMVMTSLANKFDNNGYLTNQRIIVGDNVTNLYCAFRNCQNFSGEVVIGENVTDCTSLFNNCASFVLISS